jgi:phosphatidylglycerophosphate synthase
MVPRGNRLGTVCSILSPTKFGWERWRFFSRLPSRENPLPFGFLIAILLRDVLIVTGSYYVYRKRGLVVTSNYIGKTTMFVIAITLISYTVNWVPPFVSWLTPLSLVWLSAIFITISGIQYLIRFLYYLRTSPQA